MIILPHRAKLIRKHFFEFSFDADEAEEDPKPDYEVFKTLSSAEQYFLASEYNWDDGVTVLDWIIDSPKCDRGTAIMIFWMAEPDFYFEHTEETVDEWAKDVWMLLQKILKKIKAGEFKSSTFAFNPAKNGYQVDWESAKGIWELPKELKRGKGGLKPIAMG